jgi:hypothetical protein
MVYIYIYILLSLLNEQCKVSDLANVRNIVTYIGVSFSTLSSERKSEPGEIDFLVRSFPKINSLAN